MKFLSSLEMIGGNYTISYLANKECATYDTSDVHKYEIIFMTLIICHLPSPKLLIIL